MAPTDSAAVAPTRSTRVSPGAQHPPTHQAEDEGGEVVTNRCWACVAGFHILCGGCECCGRKRHHDHPSNAVPVANALMLLALGVLLFVAGTVGAAEREPYQTRQPTAVESEQHSAEIARSRAELEQEDQDRQLREFVHAYLEGQQR